MKRATPALLVLMLTSPALAGSCDRVMEAGLKSLRTPNKATTVTSGFNVMPMTATVITIDGFRYAIRTNRNWIKTRFDQATAEEDYRDSFKGSECNANGSEAIDGDVADIFDSNYLDGDGRRVHERIWISQASGLPVREQSSIMNVGTVNLTMTTTMDYKDVQAPAGLPQSPPDTDHPDDGPTSVSQGRRHR